MKTRQLEESRCPRCHGMCLGYRIGLVIGRCIGFVIHPVSVALIVASLLTLWVIDCQAHAALIAYLPSTSPDVVAHECLAWERHVTLMLGCTDPTQARCWTTSVPVEVPCTPGPRLDLSLIAPAWLPWLSGLDAAPTFQFPDPVVGQAIVICIRAKDAAGNYSPCVGL